MEFPNPFANYRLINTKFNLHIDLTLFSFNIVFFLLDFGEASVAVRCAMKLCNFGEPFLCKITLFLLCNAL